ncbi:hypothetical protein TcasGA2_TC032544 [Tribolium castaneum]|uniref:Uncharacterized protein n=1 Tax=Tribolium castaneum TaxID=7070 RepID=A0A139WKR0_TRICA|nr:hypothetical protein TcasGA2_TC032544 [Tribolium castaneum]
MTETIKFKPQSIDNFNDKIENCLNDERCRSVLKHYVNEKYKSQRNLPIFFFNGEDSLTTVVHLVKHERCRLLKEAYPGFIEYLRINHQQ